ncbi:helix-turn-helix domain-containing protein [Halomonas sp. NO4]|uniref:MarR family transcriptional regulator n=1 Tax=Halomonas sp. NO4 TaxID=2484813 RepID=UPI0013CFE77D|nr:helix-turn-helix domain-containing protein [Halomonas sp. NO4]
MTVAATSLDAFHEHLVTGGVSQQQCIVLGILRRFGAMTRQQIASTSGIPLSSVCGRCNELLAVDQIEVVGVQYTQVGKRRSPREVLELVPDMLDKLEVTS